MLQQADVGRITHAAWWHMINEIRLSLANDLGFLKVADVGLSAVA